MPPDTQPHHRRSIRLKGYDYSQAGAYYVTILTYQRDRFLGEIVNHEMHLNLFGKIVLQTWNNLPRHYPHLKLGAFVIMPDHVHGILILDDNPQCTERHGIPEIVRALKTFSARRINRLCGSEGIPVWQRNYYEHIIRNDKDMERIVRYIETNPLRWDK